MLTRYIPREGMHISPALVGAKNTSWTKADDAFTFYLKMCSHTFLKKRKEKSLPVKSQIHIGMRPVWVE